MSINDKIIPAMSKISHEVWWWTGHEGNSDHFREYGSANCLEKRRQEGVISRLTKLSSSNE